MKDAKLTLRTLLHATSSPQYENCFVAIIIQIANLTCNVVEDIKPLPPRTGAGIYHQKGLYHLTVLILRVTQRIQFYCLAPLFLQRLLANSEANYQRKQNDCCKTTTKCRNRNGALQPPGTATLFRVTMHKVGNSSNLVSTIL